MHKLHDWSSSSNERCLLYLVRYCTFCIASFCVRFESHTDKPVTLSKSGTYTLRVRTVLWRCGCNKNICCTKGEGALDQSTVIRWLNKSRSSYKTLDEHLRPGKLKSVDSDGVLQTIEVLFTNPSARAGYDTRSIFKRSLTGLNSEFSFS